MNLILFETHELGKPLARRDERTLHLLKVLKKKAGDSFDAGVLGGDRGTGRIEAIRLDGSLVFSLEVHESPPPRLPLRMAVGFPRPIQLRRLLRDLSNLGVGEIDLLGTELGEKSYRETKLLLDGGARSALIEGAVQARDTHLPRLAVYESLDAWLRERPWDKPLPGSGGSRSPRISPILIAADNVRPEGALALLPGIRGAMVAAVGSERGWSDRERDILEDAGFTRLSMGSRALRTETACIAAAVLAMEKIGALG
ncbi:MAG: RNA methyltransferase [Treponema sp.]|nr:RNA methyltransferase [Treponema sp.]